MALIRCKECGKKVSDQAEQCPNCGFSIIQSVIYNNNKANNSKKTIKYFLLIGVIIFIAGLLKTNNENTKTSSTTSNNSISLTQNNKENSQYYTTPRKSDKDIFLDSLYLNKEELKIRNFILDDDLAGYKKGKSSMIEDILKEKYPQIKGTTLYKDYDSNEVYADEKYKNKEFMVTGAVNSVDKDFKGNALLILNGNGYFGHVVANFGESPEAISALSKIKKGSIQSMICSVDGMFIRTVHLENCHMAEKIAEKAIDNWKKSNPSNRETISFINKSKGTKEQDILSLESGSMVLSVLVKVVSLATNECEKYKDNIPSCFTRGLQESDNDSQDILRDHFISHGISKEELNSI